jgi:hypothetical protein
MRASISVMAFGAALCACACSKTPSATPSPGTSAAKPPSAPAPALWGDLKPVVSVKELMRDMIDPASDFIFESVKTEVTKKGIIETMPRTDADWEKIRVGATTIAEGIYLLKIPRPFAPPGDENNSTGPEPAELSPAQILAKLEKDPVLWNAKIEALRNVGLQTLDIVKRRNAQELWDAGENLDNACETCHLEYWYPGQTEYLKKRNRSLQSLSKPDRSR